MFLLIIAFIISINYVRSTDKQLKEIECKMTDEERDKLGGLTGNRMLNYKNYLIKKYKEE